MDDQSLDTRDLRFLWTLLETGSLVRTAERYGMSHAASCRTLARLRGVLGDRLFIKSGQGMAPSPRALALKPQIRRVLAELDALVSPLHFDAATSTKSFRLAVVDNAFLMLCGELIPEFVRRAPNAHLDIRPLDDDVLRQLKSGGLDAAVCIRETLPADFHRQTLVRGGFVCLVRRGHPLTRCCAEGEAPTLEQFRSYRRMELRVLDAKDHGSVEQRSGISPDELPPAVTSPYFVGACTMLARTDLVLVVHRSTAERFASMLPLDVVPTPWPSRSYTSSLVWHDRVHDDPAMRWFRGLFVEVVHAARGVPVVGSMLAAEP